jgi:hypothetical protein
VVDKAGAPEPLPEQREASGPAASGSTGAWLSAKPDRSATRSATKGKCEGKSTSP